MISTPHSLLARLRASSAADDWSRFVELYTPLLETWGRRAGLKHDDALDLAQDVMLALHKSIPDFELDPARKFRSWLKTVLMNKWRDRMRRLAAAPVVKDEGLSGVPEVDSDPLWEQEYRGMLVRRALEIMQAEFKEATWRACWLTVVEGVAPAEAARQLGITENAVYIARHRVLARLREELDRLLDD
jgi:RNA polymerase sigma-70 factor (ECF subfamily)